MAVATAGRDRCGAEQSGLKADRVLDSRAEAEAYVASVCFKHGPPRLVGVELEWTVHHAEDRTRPLDPGLLAGALGSHAPTTLRSDSPHRPLPAGGVVTVEPGGQVEISAPPCTRPATMLRGLTSDVSELAGILAEHGLTLGAAGADPYRPPKRLLRTPRYRAMEAAFSAIGPDGLVMMCSTASVQVCLDAGESGDVVSRWAALHEVGPVLCALFGNSRRLSGNTTRWVSARQRALFGTDPARMRPAAVGPDPATAWARRALDASVLCVRRGEGDWKPRHKVSFGGWIAGEIPGRPTVDDLDYHLSTLFPPVRPRGYLEVRYLDAQQGAAWVVPVLVLTALMAKQSTVDAVRCAVEPARSRWLHAARYGLADGRIARAAERVVELAAAALAEVDIPGELVDDVVDSLRRRLAFPEEPIVAEQRWYP